MQAYFPIFMADGRINPMGKLQPADVTADRIVGAFERHPEFRPRWNEWTSVEDGRLRGACAGAMLAIDASGEEVVAFMRTAREIGFVSASVALTGLDPLDIRVIAQGWDDGFRHFRDREPRSAKPKGFSDLWWAAYQASLRMLGRSRAAQP